MSAAAAPEPDDRPDRPSASRAPEPCVLSARDQRILDVITAHETGADPAFAARMRGPRLRVGAVTQHVLRILAVAAVVIVLWPAGWLVVGLVAVMLITGAVLYVEFRRTAHRPDPAAGHRRRETDDPV